MMVLPYPAEGTGDVETLRHHYEKQVRRGNEIEKQRWVRVNQHYTLGDVLRYQKYVIPGIPVFYVYANNSYDFG